MKQNFTIKKVSEALLKLAKNNKYDKISIVDIAKLSGMSRQNFYKNLENKEEIVHFIFVDDLCSVLGTMTIFDISTFITRFILKLESKKEFYLNVFDSSKRDYLFQMILDYLLHLCQKPSTYTFFKPFNSDEELMLEMYVAGVIAMIMRYISQREDVSLDALSEMIVSSVPKKLSPRIDFSNMTGEFMVYTIKKYQENWYYQL